MNQRVELMQQLRELELKQQLSIANESSESFDQVPPLTQTSMYYSGNLNPENLKTGLMFFCTVGMVRLDLSIRGVLVWW